MVTKNNVSKNNNVCACVCSRLRACVCVFVCACVWVYAYVRSCMLVLKANIYALSSDTRQLHPVSLQYPTIIELTMWPPDRLPCVCVAIDS